MINSSSKGGLPFHIMTVFIPRENIFILEEWLAWHTYMGVDKFYLYDNTGSTHTFSGHAIATDGKNLRGEDIRGMTSHLSDFDIDKLLNDIISKYNVEIIRWAPIENGLVVYQQHIAFDHYVKSLNKNTWTAFIDIDEFIVGDIELSMDVSVYYMESKVFRRWSPFIRIKDILDCNDKNSINENESLPIRIRPQNKSIVQTKYFVFSPEIHYIQVNDGKTSFNYRYNHYSIGEWAVYRYIQKQKNKNITDIDTTIDSMLTDSCSILNQLAEKHIKYENFTQI